MSIIKIHLFRQLNQRQQKYLLTYISDVHLTVRDFLVFAIDALKINSSVDDLIIENNDGYMLPHCLKGKIIEKSAGGTLTIKVKNPKHSSPPFQFWTAQNVPEVHQITRNNANQIDIESQGHSSEETPKFSEQGINQIIAQRNHNLSKPTQAHKKKKDSPKSKAQEKHKKSKAVQQQKSKKHKKQQKKKKKMKESSSSQSSSQQFIQQSQKQQSVQQEIQSSSEQSSEQQLPRVSRSKIVKQVPQPKFSQKQHKKKVRQQEVQQQQQEEQQIKPIHHHKQKSQKVSQKQQVQQKPKPKPKKVKEIIQEQEQQQEVKPKVKNTFLSAQNKNTHRNQQQKFFRQQSFGSDQNKNKVQKANVNINQEKTNNNPKKGHTVTYSQRKKIIQDHDIQSSDSSSSENQKYVLPEKALKSVPQKQTTFNKNKATSQKPQKMLPPALRNKFQNRSNPSPHPSITQKEHPKSLQSSFKKHMQQQWINITTQIFSQFNAKKPAQQKTFLKPNNLIKFKQIQLDQQKFIPKTSEWIQGTVLSVDSEGKLTLGRVSQLGKDYRERYEINEYNMVELQLNRNFLTEGQKGLVLREGEKDNNKASQNKGSKEYDGQKEQTRITQEVPNNSQQQQKNSIQKFICGQVNYYFSDKSYPFDLFMQMHANKHPQKYIPIRFLLNFPKIKKVLKDENKLLQYLLEDEKREARNFEIDEKNRMIRKKIMSIQDKEQSKKGGEYKIEAYNQTEKIQNPQKGQAN